MVIAGHNVKGDDDAGIQDLGEQLEARGFSVDAAVEQKKGKMEEFRQKYDAVLLVLNVQGFAQFNTMRIK